MSDSHINVGPITCQLSELISFIPGTKPAFAETILQADHPFSLQVNVNFAGPGAIALMPLLPAIQVEFYAKPLGPELGQTLGRVEVVAEPHRFIYQPTLHLGPPATVGLLPGNIYLIGAVLRVGALNWPSLINGFTEDLNIEICDSSLH